MDRKDKIILVTGASSGIGLECAALLHESGYRVYGTYRKTRIKGAGFEPLMMDVDSDESVAAGVGTILEREGRIDAAVNCAGFGICGAVEDTSIEEAKAQFETNFFGVMRVCKAVLPGMRARREGAIVNISSLGGLISAPFHALYCATKFAVEGLTEALRMEVAGFGVRVALVEPGDFKTGFTSNRLMSEAALEDPDYSDCCRRSLEAMERAEQGGPPPAMVARLVQKIIESEKPKLRYIAAPASQALAPTVKNLLPQSVFEKIIMKHFEIED